MTELTNDLLASMRKKYFPRIPWTENGPVRRIYHARVPEGTVLKVLTQLADQEGFTEPGQITVTGNAQETLNAFCAKAKGEAIGMIIGNELTAHWCDLSLGPPDPEGWQELIIRSEEGENLIALANNEKLVFFRRAKTV